MSSLVDTPSAKQNRLSMSHALSAGVLRAPPADFLSRRGVSNAGGDGATASGVLH